MAKEKIMQRSKPRYCAFFILLAILTCSHLLSAEVFVITNASNPEKVISSDDLRAIFLGEKTHWKDSTKIKLVDNLDKKVAQEFYSIYIGKQAKKIKKIWINRMLLGKMRPPESFRDQKELIEYVASKREAIAFVSKVNEEMKGVIVLKVSPPLVQAKAKK